MDNTVEYGSWTVKDLVAELKKRGARRTGKKADLVKRLYDYDELSKSNERTNEDASDEPYILTIPDSSFYKDLNSSHSLLLDKNFDTDYYNSFEGSVNIDKGKRMYGNKYLENLRKATDSDKNTFLFAKVASEFRKSVKYSVNIKITEYKCISDAVCECASGKGSTAHCKHVVVVIEAMKNFITTGQYNYRETCTEKPQSFDRPKKVYTGSPVKAKDLKLFRVKTLEDKCKSFDPRPEKCRKIMSYPSEFRNKCIHFAGLSSQSFPELYLFESANLRAFYNNHTYAGNFENFFLKSHDLTNITNTRKEILRKKQILHKEIEESTRGQSNNALWLFERRMRISSSVFGEVVLSKDPMKTASNILTPTDISHVPAIMHRKKYEVHATKKFEHLYNVQCSTCGLFVHAQYPFLASTPDGILDKDTCVEIKCPFSAKDDVIKPETVDYLYLCDRDGFFKLKKDHKYYYQVQGQLLITGKKFCIFIVYTFRDLHVVTIERDNEFIEEMLFNLLNFYHQFFKKVLLEKYLYKGY